MLLSADGPAPEGRDAWRPLPERHAWSSDRFYRKGRGPKWLDCDRVLRMLGGRRSAAVREYRRLMREKVEEPYEEVPSWGGAVKGDEAFADRILQRVGEPAVVPRGVTVERIAREVALVQGVDLSRMRGPTRDRETSRALDGGMVGTRSRKDPSCAPRGTSAVPVGP